MKMGKKKVLMCLESQIIPWLLWLLDQVFLSISKPNTCFKPPSLLNNILNNLFPVSNITVSAVGITSFLSASSTILLEMTCKIIFQTLH